MLKNKRYLSGWDMLIVAGELWIVVGEGRKTLICVNKICQCNLGSDLKPT